MESKTRIYCISGLAADERAFSKLDLQGHEITYLSWLLPLARETIARYAQRMSEGISDEKPILIGLSFGGMMAIEIAKLRPVEKVILISSVKSRREMPAWMKMSGHMRLNRIFPMRSYQVTEAVQNWFIGVVTEDDRKMVTEYRRIAPQAYIDWAVNEILKWNNNWLPDQLYHIHGDRDNIFPIRNLVPTHVVKGGGHLMIMNKATEVNAALKQILTS
jgi:pimeloyl-ACP methyl ester carboxylesterase